MKTVYKCIPTPVGLLKAIANESGLAAILWENDDPERVPVLGPAREDSSDPILRETEFQLTHYFAGKLKRFNLPLAPSGTEFQKQVWAELARIPFGETRSYGQLARFIGRPRAARAVGAANGRNPLSIVVPCHRVIGGSGKLTGFAGGLRVKAFLLELEQRR